MHGLTRPAPRDWLTCSLIGTGLGAVVLGVGGRVSMRGTAVLSGAPPGFSVSGSLTVVLMGAVAGLAGAVILMVIRFFLPGRWLIQTLSFYGALVLIMLRGIRPLDSQRLFLFLPLVLIYGFLLRVLSRRRWTVPQSSLALMLALTQALGAQRVTRNIPYRAHPSAEQYMDLYEPASARSAPALPVVLFIHGGSLEEAGERRNSPMYTPVCPGLAARGILCVTMDYRLSPSHQWPAMPADVAAAIRWLNDSVAARGGDPKRVFLVGHSSGCHLAAHVALDSGYLAAEGLSPTAVAGVVAMGCTLADAAARIGPRAPPVLVLVAESERFFPSILEEGARFVRLLRELERPADLRILVGRRHVTTTTGFADPSDFVANLVAEFVRNPTAVTATP